MTTSKKMGVWPGKPRKFVEPKLRKDVSPHISFSSLPPTWSCLAYMYFSSMDHRRATASPISTADSSCMPEDFSSILDSTRQCLASVVVLNWKRDCTTRDFWLPSSLVIEGAAAVCHHSLYLQAEGPSNDHRRNSPKQRRRLAKDKRFVSIQHLGCTPIPSKRHGFKCVARGDVSQNTSQISQMNTSCAN